MLKKEEIQNPNAIEEHFCKPLNEFKPTQLNDDQVKLMLVIAATTPMNLPTLEKEFIEVYWFYPAIEKRIENCFTYTMDTKAKMLLATWCKTIGDMVIYLTLLQYKCKQRGLRDVKFDDLALMFGDGIIDRGYMEEIWEKQKVDRDGGSDNLIDYAPAGKSLQF